MKLSLDQMAILEEALQETLVCTPEEQLEPIKDIADKFGFDFSDIFTDGKSGEIEIIDGGDKYVHKGANGLSGN